MQSEIQEPPLGRFASSGDSSTLEYLHNIIVFVRVLVWRLVSYGINVANAILGAFKTVHHSINEFKRFMIRLLMFRGGYFYQTPRLGLAAVTSTTVFSMFIFPVLDPLGQSRSLAQILSQTQIAEASSLELFDSVRPNRVLGSGQQLENEVIDYTVETGDTMSSIAAEHLVSIESIKYVNKLTGDVIRPGDVLRIPPVNGLVHTVDSSETISSIAGMYQVPAQAIVDFNHIEEPYVIHKGEDLLIPDAKIPAPKPVVNLAKANTPPSGLAIQSAPAQSGTGGFIMPTNGVITQYFWWGHTAIDVASACGTPMYAADSGTITFAGWWAGGGGNSIFIDHGNGYVTKYAHMSGFAKTGGGVSRGDVIGYVGATGRAFGCHVHFIVNQNGQPINPMSVL